MAEYFEDNIQDNPLKIELSKLYEWFIWYDIQCNQYRRCMDLDEEYDKNIIQLHNEAKAKAQRINEIKDILAPV